MPAELRATYRLQLRAEQRFEDVTQLVPYLAELGVSHLYLSPISEAAAGSTHGYDVVDHARVSSALGGEEGFARLSETTRAHGMGLIVDIVPNHMSIGAGNAMWWDVLENGPCAYHARAFDIDWDPPERKLRDVVLLPILGDHRARVVDRGELRVAREGAVFVVRYFEHRFPVAPRPVGELLRLAAQTNPWGDLAFLGDALSELPLPTALDVESVERRARDKMILFGQLAQLLERDEDASVAIDRAIDALNADPERLERFLDRQGYRLAHWRTGHSELDYRRFFDVDTLIGLRMEDARVFVATHSVIARFLSEGTIDGVRVDHVDGLANPRQYLSRLRELAKDATIHVEKILAENEALPSWPIDGTTGYEAMADLTAAFVDPRGEAPLSRLRSELCGDERSFDDIALEARAQVLRDVLGSDLRRMVEALTRLSDAHRDARDYTRHDFEAGLVALLCAFPVYRTYVEPETGEVSAADRAVIEHAVRDAKGDPELLAFLADLLLLRRTGEHESDFVRRFQQFTPPAMAKGVEDTAFYRDAFFPASCEVGGDPRRFSLSMAALHARAAARGPRTLLATSTHDTKRSEDVRARLVLLAAEHEPYAALARSFFERSEKHREHDAPDATTRLLALDAWIGAHPITPERFTEHLVKVAREAKTHTSWTRVDEKYEQGLATFGKGVLGDEDIAAEVGRFVERLRVPAYGVSLAWTLLKATMPGVPDFYQGCESWSLALVDPDNRRAVDWDAQRARLAASRGALPPLAEDREGLHKMRVVSRTLALRRRAPRLFVGAYEPIDAGDGVIAFGRTAGDEHAVVAVRRFAGSEARIALPRGTFRDVIGDGAFEGVARERELFRDRPVALLYRGPR